MNVWLQCGHVLLSLLERADEVDVGDEVEEGDSADGVEAVVLDGGVLMGGDGDMLELGLGVDVV